MRRSRPLIIAVIAVAGLAAVTSGANSQESSGAGATATADMAGPDGSAMGTVTLTEGPNGVLVQADVMGLSPGGHGFHIHGVGACTPDFGAAGGHFNPEGIGHGFTEEGGWHAGDLPNIYAAADGTARADVFTAAVTLAPGGDNSIFDADGSAIIIHAKPDSYGADPAAGDRVACGVIRLDSSDGEETAGEETAGEETAGEEPAGEEMAGEEMAGEEPAGEEMAGEEMDGDGDGASDASGGPARDFPPTG